MFSQQRGQAWRAVGLGVHLTNRTTLTWPFPSLRRFKHLQSTWAAPGGTRHRPRRHPRRDRAHAEQDTVYLLRRPPALRRRRRLAPARWQRPVSPLLLALHPRRLDAHRRRHRHLLQARHRERPGPKARRQEIEARLQAISSPFRNAQLHRRYVVGGGDAVGAGERAVVQALTGADRDGTKPMPSRERESPPRSTTVRPATCRQVCGATDR